MKIQRIDIYWVKLPLAFVWKTSYADQHFTDTILVRMEGDGHYASGNQFARAALEIAWWVLDAKRRGLPLHQALGGTRDRVAVGADFGVQDSVDILLQKIQGAIDQGFPRIKLKFRPGWDLPMVEAGPGQSQQKVVLDAAPAPRARSRTPPPAS